MPFFSVLFPFMPYLRRYCSLITCCRFSCRDGIYHDLSHIEQVFHPGREDIRRFPVFFRYDAIVALFFKSKKRGREYNKLFWKTQLPGKRNWSFTPVFP